MRNDHEDGEDCEAFQHVEVRALRPSAPASHGRDTLAIAGKQRQADLTDREEHGEQHLDDCQSGGPDKQLEIVRH